MHIEASLRGLLAAFFRQKTKFLIVFALVLSAGLIHIARIDPVFAARGSLLIKFGQGALPDVARDSSQSFKEVSHNDREEVIQANVKILQSSNLLTRMVHEFGPERLYPGLSRAVGGSETPEQIAARRLGSSDLFITPDPRSNMIEVSVTNADPVVARDFAKKLLEGFIERQLEVYSTPQSNFLQTQINEAKAKLAVSQNDFQGFKQTIGVSSLDDEMKQLLQEKSELSSIAYKAVTDAQAKLAELQAKLAEAVATYRDDSPMVERLNSNIAAAEFEVQKRRDELNSVHGDDNALLSRLSSIDERISYLEGYRSKYEDLAQRVKLDEENYKYYQQRGEEARVNDVLNQHSITRVTVVDEPQLPTRPVPAHRKLLLLATLLTAVFLGLVFAIVFEVIDDRVVYPEQVLTGLGMALLASFGTDESGLKS